MCLVECNYILFLNTESECDIQARNFPVVLSLLWVVQFLIFISSTPALAFHIYKTPYIYSVQIFSKTNQYPEKYLYFCRQNSTL